MSSKYPCKQTISVGAIEVRLYTVDNLINYINALNILACSSLAFDYI